MKKNELEELLAAVDIGLDEVSDDSSQSSDDSLTEDVDEDEIMDPKAARKAAKKRMKAKKRAVREGKDPNHGRKACDVCAKKGDLLVRCTIDASAQYKMVCGKCWKTVSGGVVDGDDAHPHYRYGGLWKNRSKR